MRENYPRPSPQPDPSAGCIWPSLGCLLLVVVWVLIFFALGLMTRACTWAFNPPEPTPATFEVPGD